MGDFFKEKGYIKVALPRTAVRPMAILRRVDGDSAEIIGTFDQLFTPPDPSMLPKVIEGEQVADFADANSNTASLSSVIGFLKGIWAKLGKGAFDASYTDNDSVTFTFNNSMADKVMELDLEMCLQSATFKGPDSIMEKFKEGEIFVITEVLYSDSFSFEVKDSGSKSLKLEVSVDELVDTNISGSTSNDATQSVLANGKKLIFGVRALKLFFGGGFWPFTNSRFSLETADINNMRSHGKGRLEKSVDLEGNLDM